MSESSDPSMVDTATLFKSMIRDIDEANACVLQAGRWLTEARQTAYELKRRHEAITAPEGTPDER